MGSDAVRLIADGEPLSAHGEPVCADPRPGAFRQPVATDGESGPVDSRSGLGDGQATSVNGELTSGDRRTGAVDGELFKSVLGLFATGVVAITAVDPRSGEPCGLAANSFTSVSLDPPLVAFCVAHTSTSWPLVKAAETHCVNVLAEDQQDVCARLAASGGDKFTGLPWRGSPHGNPVLDGALAWIECTIEAEHPAGDHVIVVSRVHRLDVHADGRPLVYYRGGFGRFHR